MKCCRDAVGVAFPFITSLIQGIRSFAFFSFVTFEVFTSLYLVNRPMCIGKFHSY